MDFSGFEPIVRAYPCQVDYLSAFRKLKECASNTSLTVFPYLVYMQCYEHYIASENQMPTNEPVISPFQARILFDQAKYNRPVIIIFWDRIESTKHDHFSLLIHYQKPQFSESDSIFYNQFLYFNPSTPFVTYYGGPNQERAQTNVNIPKVVHCYMRNIRNKVKNHLVERHLSFPCFQFPPMTHCITLLKIFLIEIQPFDTYDKLLENWFRIDVKLTPFSFHVPKLTHAQVMQACSSKNLPPPTQYVPSPTPSPLSAVIESEG